MSGPGYRIYFGKDGAQLVLLLLGGDKSTPDGRRGPGTGIMFWKILCFSSLSNVVICFLFLSNLPIRFSSKEKNNAVLFVPPRE